MYFFFFRFGVSKIDKDTLTDLKQKKFGVTEPEEEKKRKKKKGGPNPLSCKKKKSATKKETVPTNKKKRKRPKVSKHVREHWASLVKEDLASTRNSLASKNN
jgi:U3 small nucleolar RNA-associated protein 23